MRPPKGVARAGESGLESAAVRVEIGGLGRRCTALVIGVLAAAVTTPLPASAAASTDPPWASLATAKVHPGQLLDTAGSDCTSNFVFTDADRHVYIGQAAHCSSEGGEVDFDGCNGKTLPLGTAVTVVESGVRGVIAYNSWEAMQRRHEKNPSACADNDLALVRLPDSVRPTVSPDVPYFGGPHGVNQVGAKPGDRVYSYGNSPIRGGIGMLAPKSGTVLTVADHGWSYLAYFATPGIPGDSGSAVLDGQGRALGVLSSLIATPSPGSNGVADLSLMLAYARDMSGIHGLRLVDGMTPFNVVTRVPRPTYPAAPGSVAGRMGRRAGRRLSA